MKRKRWVAGVAIAVAALALLFFAGYTISRSRTFQFFGGIVNRVDTEAKVVALTFDDGPTARTDKVLAELDRAQVKATFFLVGQSIEEYPEETKRIAEAGHQLANHSWSHQRMVLKFPSFISSEIEKTDAAIRDAGYQGDIQFRPPYGKKLLLLPWYLSRHSRKTILWDLEPNSIAEVDASTENIVKYVVDNSQPGSIILLHVMYDGKGNSIAAIGGIAEGLKAKGYEFVTVNELLSYNER